MRDADLLGRVAEEGLAALQQAKLFGQRVVNQGVEQLGLRAEVVVEGADRDVRVLGDVCDRRVLDAPVGEQVPRRVEQAPPCACLAPLDPTTRAPRDVLLQGAGRFIVRGNHTC